MTQTRPEGPSRSSLVLQLLRSIWHLSAVILVAFWAFTAWPSPFPGLLIGLAALALTVVLWALFLSPRPVLRTDRFSQALIELLLLAGAAGALLALDVDWPLAAAYFIVGAVLGYLAGRRR